MELKTETLDRVLEALSPTLSTEIDRVVRETRQAMEQEFESRLQTALREAETAAAATLETEVQRARAETAEVTRKQVNDELEQQFNEKLNAASTQAKELEFESRLQTALREAETAAAATLETEVQRARAETAEVTRKQVNDELEQHFNEKLNVALAEAHNEGLADQAELHEELERWRSYAEAQGQLSDASSQPEILSRFLRLAEPFGDNIAIYVVKPNGLGLWGARDKTAFSETISQETIKPDSYFRMTTVRGKIVAAIYASQPFKAEALDFLARSLEHAIEVFGLRLQAQK